MTSDLREGAEILNDSDFTSFAAWMHDFVHDDRSYQEELAQQRTSGMQPASIPVLVKGGYQPPVTVTATGRAPTVTYQPRGLTGAAFLVKSIV